MTIKVWNAMKSISVLSLLLLLIVSCSDDDLNSIDAGIINNLNFVTTEIISEVEFSNEDISSVRSSANGQFLLGVYEEDEISKIRGSFVSQLILPTDIYYSDFIEPDTIVTATIDDVVLYIPYHATALSVEAGLYTYQLDSIFGIKDATADNGEPFGVFDFKVHELATFLNPLDPTDPSKANTYYSDKDYAVATELGSSVVGFSPTAIDTVTYIKRFINGIEYQTDTVTLGNNAPRIAVHLDTDFFQTEFLDKLPAEGETIPSEFQSQSSFVRYFKGLFVNTTSDAAGSMATLPLTNAYVDMYYTNQVSLVSTGNDVDTIAKTMKFSLGGVKAVKYESTVSAAQDLDKLYIQGTAGSQANIRLFGYDENDPTNVSMELDTLRNGSVDGFIGANDAEGNNLWLINEANLLLYIDDAFEATDPVYRLYLYKKVPDIGALMGYNSQLLDYLTAANLSFADGVLTEDEDGDYYKFKLTDYVTELLMGKDEDGVLNSNNVDNLGLRIFNEGDYPTTTSDTLVGSESWNPRGVVLFGGASGDDSDPKRLKLKINYSYQNR